MHHKTYTLWEMVVIQIQYIKTQYFNLYYITIRQNMVFSHISE